MIFTDLSSLQISHRFRAANRSKGTQRPTTVTVSDLIALMGSGMSGLVGDLLDFLSWMLHSHMWQSIDKDHSGSLSVREVEQALRLYFSTEDTRLASIKACGPMLEDICRKMRAQVKHEFGSSMGFASATDGNAKREKKGAYYKLFKKYDRDESGGLGDDDLLFILRKGFHIHAHDLSQESVVHLRVAMNVDGTGTVSVSDFESFMEGHWKAGMRLATVRKLSHHVGPACSTICEQVTHPIPPHPISSHITRLPSHPIPRHATFPFFHRLRAGRHLDLLINYPTPSTPHPTPPHPHPHPHPHPTPTPRLT